MSICSIVPSFQVSSVSRGSFGQNPELSKKLINTKILYENIKYQNDILRRYKKLTTIENDVLKRFINQIILFTSLTSLNDPILQLTFINKLLLREKSELCKTTNNDIAIFFDYETDELLRYIGCTVKEKPPMSALPRGSNYSQISINSRNITNSIFSETASPMIMAESNYVDFPEPRKRVPTSISESIGNLFGRESRSSLLAPKFDLNLSRSPSKGKVLNSIEEGEGDEADIKKVQSIDVAVLTTETFDVMKINRFSMNTARQIEVNANDLRIYIKNPSDNTQIELSRNVIIKVCLGDKNANSDDDPLLATIWYYSQLDQEIVHRSYEFADVNSSNRFVNMVNAVFLFSQVDKLIGRTRGETAAEIKMKPRIKVQIPSSPLALDMVSSPVISPITSPMEVKEAEVVVDYNIKKSNVAIRAPPPPIRIIEKKVENRDELTWEPYPIKTNGIVLARDLIDIVYEIGTDLSALWLKNGSKSIFGFGGGGSKTASSIYGARPAFGVSGASDSKFARTIAEDIINFIFWLGYGITTNKSNTLYETAIIYPHVAKLHAKLSFQLNEVLCETYLKQCRNNNIRISDNPNFCSYDDLNPFSRAQIDDDITAVLNRIYEMQYELIPPEPGLNLK